MIAEVGGTGAVFQQQAFEAAVVALARAPTPSAPDSVVAGKSAVDWTAAWWTWAQQSPVAKNPFTDSTGAFAHVNNDGPVFFVAGTNGVSGTVTRTFTAPAGKPLLVPMINFFDLSQPKLIPPPPLSMIAGLPQLPSLPDG